MAYLSFDNYSFSYSGSEETVLKNISLDVEEGSFVCLFGPNGSGKTTLLKQIKNIISPHGKAEGVITINGTDVRELSQEKQATDTGFIFQNPDSQIVCDDCIHEMAFGLENIGLPREEIHQRISEVCTFFGIQGWIHKKVDTLSGGEKQILNLVSVMALRPSLLLLDEPVSQLDQTSQEHFLSLLKKLNEELNVTIIICEHRMEEVIGLSDMLVFMDGGRIISSGEPSRVMRDLYAKEDRYVSMFPCITYIGVKVTDGREIPFTLKEAWGILDNADLSGFDYEHSQKKRDLLISVSDLNMAYGRNEHAILKDVSFTLGRGEILSVMGGNGSGKSTLLRCICGTQKYQYGKIKKDKDLRIRMLPQNVESLFKAETVKDEISAYSSDEDKLKSAIEMFGLEDFLERHPFDISGGEQQKLALGILYLTEADVLLLDEPTKNLDFSFRKRLGDILKSHCGKGGSVIIVSHDLEFCAENSDRVAMLFNGELMTDDDVHHFFYSNTYYTTPVNRLCRRKNRKIITREELLGEIVNG